MLSRDAETLLQLRLAGERVELTSSNGPIYEELVRAQLMEPVHTLTGGDRSGYRLTEAAILGHASRLASTPASPSHAD